MIVRIDSATPSGDDGDIQVQATLVDDVAVPPTEITSMTWVFPSGTTEVSAWVRMQRDLSDRATKLRLRGALLAALPSGKEVPLKQEADARTFLGI